MSDIFATTALIVMIVLSREQVLLEIPIGTPENIAVEYFEQITKQENIHYYTRETAPWGTVSYNLKSGEIGYYMVGVDGVQSRSWWPSFGRQMVIIVAISDSKTVSHIEFFGSRAGWP